MNTKTKRNFLSFLTTLMFLALVSVFCMPLMASAAPSAHTAHSGHKDHEGWTAVSSADDLYDLAKNGGSGYLTCDIEFENFCIFVSSKEVNLCLNGYSASFSHNDDAEEPAFVVGENGILNLYDESGNSGLITHSEGYGTGLEVCTDGKCYMYGGNIFNNHTSMSGGGVDVYDGTFTMNGGTISGNYAYYGGGVFVDSSGTFVMNGGKITENSAMEGGVGAGVCSVGNFTMNGGKIQANEADSVGGGVFNNGIFTMNKGSIMNNSADNGGGVFINEGTFTMNGGSVYDNSSEYDGGGVFNFSTFIMKNGKITGNISVNYAAGGGVSNCNTFTMSGGEISNNYSYKGAGVSSAGQFTFEGGKIVENSADSEGGGIFINESGSFSMTGGTISGNYAAVEGGGVYAKDMFTIEGGEIKDNKAEDGGTALAVCTRGVIVNETVKGTILSNADVHTILFTPNNGSGKEITQYYSKEYADNMYANKFTRSGYTFAGWNTKANGNGTSYSNKAKINFTKDITLYAQWAPKKYTVTFNANGGSGTMETQSIKYNTSTALNNNTFEKEGYEFAGWNTKADGSGTSYEDGAEVKLNILNKNKITLYAQWKVSDNATYTVEHYKQKLDGTYAKKASATDILKGKINSKVTPAVKTYTGFTSPETKTEKVKADGSLVIKYYYVRNSYKLTWDFAGGSAKGDYTKGSVKYDAAITAPVPTRAGYTFNGWKTEVPEKMPAKDLTIKATWKAKTNTKYTVEHYKQKVDGTYPATASESESFTGKTASSVTPEVKTYKGFTSPEAQTVKIKGDGSLVVKYFYTRNSYKLTWDFAGGSAKGSYTKGNVKYGAKITAPVPTRDGYEFTGWDKTVASKMPANDLTYKAKWRKLSQEEQVRKFVERFYTIILERPADEAGLNDWTNRLISKQATGADVAAGFINSEEFQKKKMTDEEYVTKLYRAFFDREPDKDGYNGWLRELKNGKTRDDVLRGFINSPEFNNLCKKYGINTGSY